MNSNYFFINFVKLNRFIENIFIPIKKVFSLAFIIFRKPFMLGYNTYKKNLILKFLNKDNQELNFENCESLDERVVEYNWLFQEINKIKFTSGMRLLDAGSTLNQNYLLKKLNKFQIYIQTLYPEKYCEFYNKISYIYADFTDKIFREEYFDVVCCISVLEHVGFDNSKYKFFEDKKNLKDGSTDNTKYLKVVNYFKTILKGGGVLFITVPFGRYLQYQNLQQFNEKMVQNIIKEFDPKKFEIKFAKFKDGTWSETNAKSCSKCEIKNIDNSNKSNKIASAEAVALLKLIK